MPFQAIPYAERTATGTTLSKLIWIRLVGSCHLDGYADTDVEKLSTFTHASRRDVLDALHHLRALGLIYWPENQFRHVDDWCCCICKLPVSEEPMERRKRLRLTLDQLNKIADHNDGRCATCGSGEFDIEDMHADHIIPRSRGGADVEDNFQLLCPQCNMRKGTKRFWVDYL